MKRVESFNYIVTAINKHSEPIETDDVMTAFLIEIAGSLVVIADAMTEEKDGENHDD